MNEREKIIFDLVRTELVDELIPDEYRNLVDSPLWGHCFHASQAMYVLLGGKESGYKLQQAFDEKEIKHYWLVNSSEEIIDPTVEQYTDLSRPLPYKNLKNNNACYIINNTAKFIVNNVKSKLQPNA